VCSTHMRTVSQPEGGDEDWSGNVGPARRVRGGGGTALSADTIPYNSSGIGLLMENHIEMVLETQVHNQFCRGLYVKVLVAKRILELQKDACVTFLEEDGTTTKRLVVLEEVAEKLKASREHGTVRQ